jgi:hypothetical protein
MRIRALLILATTLLGVMALSGAALAATKTCSANPCVGTKGADRLKGNATKNEIRGLRGADYIAGKQRADDLYGNRARTRCVPATAETACSAGGAGTSSTAAAETTR